MSLNELFQTACRIIDGLNGSVPYEKWGTAGGPDECEHGYAAGIPCPSCDLFFVRSIQYPYKNLGTIE